MLVILPVKNILVLELLSVGLV